MIHLVAGTISMFDAEIAGDHSALATLLGVRPIVEWPPIGGEHDLHAVGFFRETILATPDVAGWMAHYVLRNDELVGSAGFFGPPTNGMAEIGYSICQVFRRQGLATEAVRALIDIAREREALAVCAHVKPDNIASIRVLVSTGFVEAEPDDTDHLLFIRNLM
jgi:[ribosomal protein S5]-alanine N-acetyltransferase